MAYSALSRVTRGLIAPPGSRGLSLASLGMHIKLAGAEPEEPEEPEELPLLSGNIQDIRFIEVDQYLFANPNKDYTGYAADGFWRTSGELDPAHTPFKASWASEGENPGTDRGDLDRFPDKIFVISTDKEVTILNADDNSLWMRFFRNPGTSTGSGTLLGDVGTAIRQADFVNGFLVMATSDGLRIADFRQDIGIRYGESDSSKSTVGLENRNQDLYPDAVAVVGATKLVVNDDCTCLDVAVRSELTGASLVKSDVTVAAVGHPDGLSGVKLAFPSQTDVEVLLHPFAETYSNSWSVIDDGDGDDTSPYFTDVGMSWSSDDVQVGDTIRLDNGVTYTILEVQADRLVLDPEMLLSATGAASWVKRPVNSVEINLQGHLVFANGNQLVTLVPSAEWYDGTPFYGRVHDTVKLSYAVASINDVVRSDENFFIATDVGVFHASLEDLENAQLAEFRYSIDSLDEPVASYKILAGDILPVAALGIDPETGQLAVACTEDGSSVVSEIDLNIHQTFRFFDNVGEVNAIVTYRHPEGPHVEEETE